MRIGIKVGSALLVKEGASGNEINREFLLNLCRQIAELLRFGHEVFLVTSGAVASDGDESRSKALRAAIGQPKLMELYRLFMGIFGTPVAQMLLIADEFRVNRDHIAKILEEALAAKVLPVINANDAINSEELDRLEEFADNDRLFGEVCLLVRADAVIICTEVDGLLDLDGSLIPEINDRNFERALELAQGGSKFGHGPNGMQVKLRVGHELSNAMNARVIIVNGHSENCLIRAFERLMSDPPMNFGTFFCLK